jgi:glycosyltransferase involved in cell wall biosynthesis
VKFSLVLATIGRVGEVKRFLASLERQQIPIELIVVDQNQDDRLVPVLQPYANRFNLVHIRSSPGLSKARNLGLARITGDVIGFPDDDCWYPDGVLARVRQLLSENENWDGLTGRSVDGDGQPSAGQWAADSGVIPLFGTWNRAISFTVFLRRSVVETVGAFDESLGVGSPTPWQSGEETDYVMRSVASGFRLWYQHDLTVCHPNPTAIYDAGAIARGRRYARGFGRVLRKHRFPLRHVFYWLSRPAGGLLIAALSGHWSRAAFQWAVLRGRLEGWLAARN